jgi:selenocysteine lyase/cysteine desulfurase
MNAAIEYLAELGDLCDGDRKDGSSSHRQRLVRAMEAICQYERCLSGALLAGIGAIKGATVYGIQDPKAIAQRLPTFLFNLAGVPPATVAARLAAKGIAVRDGNMYSPRLMKRLVLSEGGAVRASLVHYNTQDEIRRFVNALEEIAGN